MTELSSNVHMVQLFSYGIMADLGRAAHASGGSRTASSGIGRLHVISLSWDQQHILVTETAEGKCSRAMRAFVQVSSSIRPADVTLTKAIYIADAIREEVAIKQHSNGSKETEMEANNAINLIYLHLVRIKHDQI